MRAFHLRLLISKKKRKNPTVRNIFTHSSNWPNKNKEKTATDTQPQQHQKYRRNHKFLLKRCYKSLWKKRKNSEKNSYFPCLSFSPFHFIAVISVAFSASAAQVRNIFIWFGIFWVVVRTQQYLRTIKHLNGAPRSGRHMMLCNWCSTVLFPFSRWGRVELDFWTGFISRVLFRRASKREK